MTKPYKFIKNDTYFSIPPSGGKSLMMEAMESLTQELQKGYDKAYQMMFDEIKEKDEGFHSDEELHKFIEENISFAVEVQDGSIRETPKIFIVPKWKMEEE